MLTTQERKQRYWGISITLGSIIASCILNLGVSIPFLACPLLRYTGIPCPAWGLTRSFIATARGDLEQAMKYHGLGSVLFAAFLVIGLHLGLELLKNRKIEAFYLQILVETKFQLFGFLMLFSYHGVRLQGLWQSGKLYPSFLASPLGIWLFGS